MRVPAKPTTSVPARCLVTAFLVAACSAPVASPPPAEPYDAFSPVEVKVKSDPDWLAVGFGSLWVKRPEGSVDRIDPASGSILEEIAIHEPRPEACHGLGTGADSVWTCDAQDLVRIDPATNEVVETVAVGKILGQGRLVRAADRIWVLTGNGDRLIGVDEADGSMSDPIALPVACNDLGAAADVVYVACEREDRVLRVDPASGAVTAASTIDGPTWVSAAEGGVWVSGAKDVYRLDPVTLSTAITVPGMATGYLGSIWADADGLWVRKVDPFLTKVTDSGAIARIISADLESGGDVVVDGGHVWASVLDDRLLIRLDIAPEG